MKKSYHNIFIVGGLLMFIIGFIRSNDIAILNASIWFCTGMILQRLNNTNNH